MNVKRIITITITALAVAMATFSGIMKLMGGPEIVSVLDKVGVAPYRVMLGVMEITFALLFAFPKTLKIGFILLSCYFAGAIATELSRAIPLNALLPIILVWIAAFLRDNSIFLPTLNSK